MSRETSEEFRVIVELWRERFGEPPPILTDADLMWQVIRSSPANRPDDPKSAAAPN